MTTLQTQGVLVTGAAGYLGRLTVEKLAQDPTIRPLIACDIQEIPEALRIEGVTYRQLDIRDAAEVDAAVAEIPGGTLIHLAAIVDSRKKGLFDRQAPDDGRQLSWDVDVRGTRHVLESAVRHGIGKLIVTSSGAAYGYHPDNAMPLTEQAPIRGNEVFAYSHHKRLVEQLLADFRKYHPELKQLIFRVGTILGAETKNQITAIFERPAIIGIAGSTSPFNFIWDQDVVACLVQGTREPEKEGIFNLAGDGVMTLAEIAESLGKPYVPLPAKVVSGVLRALDRLRISPYGPEQVIFLQYRPVLDNEKLKTEFAFTPKATREVFEIYREAR